MATKYYQITEKELLDLHECVRTVQAIQNNEDMEKEVKLGLKAIKNAIKRNAKKKKIK